MTHLISSEELAEARKIYVKLDSEGYGKLTKEDLLKAYQKAHIAPPSISHLIDLCRGQGQCMEFTDFAIASFDWESVKMDDKLRRVFDDFSVNGIITQEGVTDILQSINYSEVEVNQATKFMENSPLYIDRFLNLMKQNSLV